MRETLHHWIETGSRTLPRFPAPPSHALGALGSLALGFALVLFLAPAASAIDRAGFSMEILVDARPIDELVHDGTIYVEASRGREYSIRLRNSTGERIAVALSVDGLNSIDARTTTAAGASKWILGPWETITLDGWQTSSSSARRFFFTSESLSYGAWLGSTKNLGVITAAVFREKCARPVPYSRLYPQWDPNSRDGRYGAPRDRNSSYPEPKQERDRLAAPQAPNDGPPAADDSEAGAQESGSGGSDQHAQAERPNTGQDGP